MNTERVGRFELIFVWQRKLQELQSQGECTRHLEEFLERVQQLPGDTVSDMAYFWCQSQANRRPIASLLLILMVGLTAMVAFASLHMVTALMLVGVVSGLAVHHLQILWQSEQKFHSELQMRAAYALNNPCWNR